jgi:hypothetical protein
MSIALNPWSITLALAIGYQKWPGCIASSVKKLKVLDYISVLPLVGTAGAAFIPGFRQLVWQIGGTG